ncbi:hypothetical protein O163_04700 [Caldanaerobacter subterraneus subsp. yonseiensis KB-1]|uniref:Uncharacterized protein n=1 Tax=Caldanaerobacter subterraneus subsp. yonseiensis KB-1 TaxID=1388761 RepID=U5CRS8_CALSX|nr:hypothetical protein O163_04700 [Caldanaerobacter subterraneus subsp. yonseiensis KB-1]
MSDNKLKLWYNYMRIKRVLSGNNKSKRGVLV